MRVSKSSTLLKTPFGRLVEKSELWRRAKLKSDWISSGYKYHILRSYVLHRSLNGMDEKQKNIVLGIYPEAAQLFGEIKSLKQD